MSTRAGDGREKSCEYRAGAPPELVPVKASVFDDDFFRSFDVAEVSLATRWSGRAPEATLFPRRCASNRKRFAV